MKLIFVCHGNICRSPMAEYIMKDLVGRRGLENEFSISSAAVSYEEEGNGLYPYAAQTLTRHGIPFSQHRAHRISLEEYLQADMVIVMDSSNERLLSRITGGRDPEKTHRMLEWTGEDRDVADPWYTGNFEKAYSDILAGCTALLNYIAKRP
ncbi:MAG: low molecular weight protein-tyrosine-phosphatase [Candidatus Cryptobacteroides sp.]